MAIALARHPGILVHIVHDERSAGFMAVGLALESGKPAILLSTSGTAAVHFHAAVVEADLSALPLIAVTADRPPELHGVFAPQTINQRNLYGDSVRWYCEPGAPDEGGSPWWRDLARDALVRARDGLPGPVHLNLAFREPLLGAAGELPARAENSVERQPARVGLPDEDLARLIGLVSGRRGIILAGVRTTMPSDDDQESERKLVLGLASDLGWPVFADAASGVRVRHPAIVSTFDLLLRNERFASERQPEVVLRFGGLLTSRVLNAWLISSRAVQVAFDRYGRCPDPDRVLSRSHPVSPPVVAEALIHQDISPAPADWLASWNDADKRARVAVERGLVGLGEVTEPAAVMDVLAAVPTGGRLVVSSSMPIRDLEWFAAPRDRVVVHSNRGANGIDGVTSTAIGVALGSGAPTVLLVGDVAFLHDSAALTGLRSRDANLVIVVIDNDGGGIFSFLPQAQEMAEGEFEVLFGTPHGTDLRFLAAAHGLAVEQVRTRAGLQAALAGALHRRGPRVIIARSDRKENVGVHQRLNGFVAAAVESRAV